MTEKLLTGTLSLNTNKHKQNTSVGEAGMRLHLRVDEMGVGKMGVGKKGVGEMGISR